MHGGPSNERGIGASRLASHASLAVTGLVLWLGWLWLAVAALAIVIAIGFWMFAMWVRGRSPRERRTELPAETWFPVPVVFAHGLLAATTLVLALVAVLA